jgi:hypothetical protein
MTHTRTAAVAATALLALSACGSSESDDENSAPAPDYTAITEDLPEGGIGEVDLLIPDATIEQAQAAIIDYASGIDGPSAVTIEVVRGEGDAVIVCRADWPDIDATMNCPDPAGE